MYSTSKTIAKLRTGYRFTQHAEHGNIKIGDTCMVYSGSDACSIRTKRNAQTKQSTSHSELGICIFFSSEITLGSYQFLVQSGAIESRRIFKKVDVPNPFGFPNCPVYVARTAASMPTATKSASVSVTTPRRFYLSVASPFTLVASGPAATAAPVKSPICLPQTLDFLVDDKNLPDVDFALPHSLHLQTPLVPPLLYPHRH